MVAVVLADENETTWHVTEVRPLTMEARREERDQNRGTLARITCELDPNEENSDGNTLETMIGGGAVQKMVSVKLMGTTP